MEGSGSETTTTATSPSSSSSPHPPTPTPTPTPTPPPPQSMVISPCAACKILRRRCVEKCVLAPYFPPHDPLKFTTAHRVFGASNIIKFLQELPEAQRDDAVSSMVYEANARLREPVYGCAGAISQLQKKVNELHEQLAKAQAELVNVQCQNANLTALICMEMSSQSSQTFTMSQNEYQQHMPGYNSFASYISDATSFLDHEGNLGFSSEQSLWT